MEQEDINLNGSQMEVPPRKIGSILSSGTRGFGTFEND
jgi:hypothetical protein